LFSTPKGVEEGAKTSGKSPKAGRRKIGRSPRTGPKRRPSLTRVK
jgi:hypothetical protein